MSAPTWTAEMRRGILLGALAGSAAGLQVAGEEPGAAPRVDPAARPAAEVAGHPAGAWSAVLEPAVVAATVLRNHPACLTLAGPTPAERRAMQAAFAAALTLWGDNGFREWRTQGAPSRVEPQLAAVLRMQGYTTEPARAAAAIYPMPYSCGPFALAIAAAALAPSAAVAARLTLDLAACTAVRGGDLASLAAAALHVLARGGRRAALRPALQEARALVAPEAWAAAVKAAAAATSLSGVGGRDRNGRDDATLQCFFWAVRRVLGGEALEWGPALADVCAAGGAADVNAALVGALIGAVGGAAALPAWAAQLEHAEWVLQQCH